MKINENSIKKGVESELERILIKMIMVNIRGQLKE
jgi:hypothetical protein